jgi:hypothetical protein
MKLTLPLIAIVFVLAGCGSQDEVQAGASSANVPPAQTPTTAPGGKPFMDTGENNRGSAAVKTAPVQNATTGGDGYVIKPPDPSKFPSNAAGGDN